MKNNGLTSLVNNMFRYDERQTEDFTCIHNTMGIFENIMEMKGEEVAYFQ